MTTIDGPVSPAAPCGNPVRSGVSYIAAVFSQQKEITPRLGSDSSALGRTAAVMGQRSNVDNLSYLDAGAVDGTDGGFAAVAGTLYIGLHLAEAKVESGLGTILCGHLGSVGRILLRATEAHFTCAGPGDDLTI